MSDDLHTWIDRYFSGELPEEERKRFEEKMRTDAAFRDEVEAHRQALYIIRQEGRKQLKEKLETARMGSDRRHHRRRLILLLGILLAGFLAMLCYNYSFLTSNRNRDPVEIDSPAQTQTPPPVETIVQDSPTPDMERTPDPLPPREDPRQMEENKADHLFAASFTPFADESLAVTLRGDHPAGPVGLFVDAYLDQDHHRALELFDSMDPYDRNNDNMLFLRANSLMATGRYREATSLLQSVQQRDTTRFIQHVEWYLALGHIASGETNKARTLLLQVRDSGNNLYREKAIVLLEKL